LGFSEDDVSLHPLKKEDQHFPCGAILDVEKNGQRRFVVDNFQGSEIED
jgi:hypothetical protein